jgi:hypothetical protein
MRGHATLVDCLREELCRTLGVLRDLQSHIEWEDDIKPVLDTEGLMATCSRAESLLARFDDNGSPIGEFLPPERDRLSRLLTHTRDKLRTAHGLDITGPITDLDRACWTRELAVDVLASVGQLFDRVGDVCLAREEVALWRRRKAMEALFRALQLAQLYGIDEEALLRDIGAEGEMAACSGCGGTGRVMRQSRYIGGADEWVACPGCAG